MPTFFNESVISDREGLAMNIYFPISQKNVVKYARNCCHMVTNVVKLIHERETNDGRRTTSITPRERMEPVQAHQTQTGISVCSEVEKRRGLHHIGDQSTQSQKRRSPGQDRTGIKKAGLYLQIFGSVAQAHLSSFQPLKCAHSSSYLNSFYDIALQIATSRTNDGGGRECIRMTQVYTLTDPRTDIVRYVGISENAQKRYKQHLNTHASNGPKNEWIKELQALGLQPILTIIEETPDRHTAMEREKEWVNHYAQKHLLVNFNLNIHAIEESLSSWEVNPELEEQFLRDMEAGNE
jgi:predicted GIY-YIG superfamily endonuclease